MERVSFQNIRGLELVGDFWSAGTERFVIMSHGFPHDRNEEGLFTEMAEKLNQGGFNVLVFDFSGNGESDKTPITIQKEVEDLDAAIEFCKDRGAKN